MKTLLRALGIYLFDRFREEDEVELIEAQRLAAGHPDLLRRNKKLHDDLVEVLETLERLEDEAASKKKPAPKKRTSKKSAG
jgi:hypothetical protein